MNLAESYYYDFKTSDLIFKSYKENFNFILNKIKSYQDVKEIQVKENQEKSINQEAPEIVYDSIGNISSHIFKDFKSLLDKINKENLQYLDFYELFLNLKEIKSELMSINIDRGYVSKES
jgi:hypothetical protein